MNLTGIRSWARDLRDLLRLDSREKKLLAGVYAVGLALRLIPRLQIDSHLLTWMADVWYRLCMGQYILDHHALPEPDIRYLPYGPVPMYYPPLSPILLALAGRLTGLDLPTVCSRMLPFFEALSPLTIYYVGRKLYSERTGAIATVLLALTPSFVYFTGISDPQSFTMFVIPLAVTVWVWHSEKPDRMNVLAVGLLLGLNFLLHLSYFLEVLILLTVSLALILQRRAGKRLLADLAISVGISQLLVAPWWLPRSLYWWWIRALVTSSGLYSLQWDVSFYGTVAAIAGGASLIYLMRGPRRHLVTILWALPCLLESQNERIISALHMHKLTWTTLAKPLEGFRFFPFLAQPLSLAIAVAVLALQERMRGFGAKKERVLMIPLILILAAYGANLVSYGLFPRFQNSGMTIGEYEAAVWFGEHTGPEARIAADYYRAQMIAGVCGGKSLLGGMFPLRNVDFPYIRAPGTVQNDLYILYNTSDPLVALGIAERYNLTHVFYSTNMMLYGNLLSRYKPASEFGVDVDTEKFQEERYFEIIYREEDVFGEVVIVAVKA